MKPIKAPSLIENGIVVYTPGVSGLDNIKVSIFYSPKNPLFSWSFCEESPFKIWEKQDKNYDKGILFIYRTNRPLKKGFYKINVKAFNDQYSNVLEGSQTYGVIQENKNTLYIGLPYSSFGPINIT